MAENHLVVGIRRILSVEERSMEMKMSRNILAMVALVFLLPAFLIGTYAQQADTKAEPKTKPDRSRAAVLQILQEAVRSADALKDARSKAMMLVAVATGRARTGEQASARAAFQQAVEAADAIPDLSSRVYTLEDIAAAQCDAGERTAALATMHHASGVIETIGDEHQRNNARMWTVRTYARAGDFDAALTIVRSLPGASEYNGRALVNIMEGLKQANKAEVKRFFPTLLQEAEAFTDATRQAACLQGFANVLAEIGDVETTKKIAETLEMAVAELGLQDHRGIQLHDYQTLVLSALGKAQARAGNRQAALETFQKAAGLTTWMPAEYEALRSDRLARLVRDRVDAGDIEGALQTAALIVYEYHKANALIEIAEAQAKAGRRDEARSLFRKAIQTAGEIKIRDPLRDRPGDFRLNSSVCLLTIAFVQARAGFAAEAIQTAESIDEPSRKNSALAQIVRALAERGEIAAAVQLLPKIGDEKSKTYALQAIAEGQAKTGDVQGAWDWAKSLATPEARATALLGVVRAIVKRPAGTL